MPKRWTKIDVSSMMDHVFRTEIQELRRAGQAEYAQEDDRPFRNFEESARELGIAPTQAWGVLAKKHWDGIASHIRGHKSQRENVRGRLNDLIVYLFLLRAMIEEEEGTDTPRSGPRLETKP